MKDSILLLAIRWLKFAMAGLLVYGFRRVTHDIQQASDSLIFINLSALMATQFAGVRAFGPKRGGLLSGMIYGCLSMVAIDYATGNISMTWITAPMYGLTALWGLAFLRKPQLTRLHYVGASIAGTIVFDLVTGVLIAPLGPYHQTMGDALVNQIPVTLMGILTNSAFACACPLLAKLFSSTVLEETVVGELGYLAEP